VQGALLLVHLNGRGIPLVFLGTRELEGDGKREGGYGYQKNRLFSQETHVQFVSGRTVAYALLTLEPGKVAGPAVGSISLALRYVDISVTVSWTRTSAHSGSKARLRSGISGRE
jgi:hypothetical protein